MKNVKSFVILGIIVLLLALFSMYYSNAATYKIEAYGEANIQEDIFNPLIAKSVNTKALSLTSGDYTIRQTDGIYMNEQMQLMIPSDKIMELFSCSAELYNNKKLVIKKYDTTLIFYLNKTEYELNGKKYDTKIAPTKKDGCFYAPANIIADALEYEYVWSIDDNVATLTNVSKKKSIVPSSYDLRDEDRDTDIFDQGRYGTCWAFSAITSIESILSPEESVSFSVDHMSISNSFAASQNEGGDYTMGMAYLAAWQGPVYEKDDPYGDNKSDDSLEAVKHVQQMQLIEDKDYETIKEYVMLYGGVQTSLYNSLSNSFSGNEYYDRNTSAYYYYGSERPNHDVVIIGWDDDYPKENFATLPEDDGAFICQNSWGYEFGENGYFYVSYYDTDIGLNNVAYTRIDDSDNYDNIYQTDLCGWVGQIGYGSDGVYGANVYHASSKQDVCAAGFYATGENTEYEIYICANYKRKSSLKKARLAASGTLDKAGYYTIDFDRNIRVKKGRDFAVILHIATEDEEHPLAIEYNADEATEDVDLKDGTGFISMSGEKWVDIEEGYSCNICLKAFTNNVDEDD